MKVVDSSKVTQENLNYGAKGLRGIFEKYFPTDALAAQYERKPEKIVNRVYGGRMGNGAEATGEGNCLTAAGSWQCRMIARRASL